MTQSTRFDPCSIKHEGNTLRAMRIRCGHLGCHVNLAEPVNTFWRGSGEDLEQTNRQAERKFEKKGWRVGARAKDDRCPGCVAEELRLKRPAPGAAQTLRVAPQAPRKETVLDRFDRIAAPIKEKVADIEQRKKSMSRRMNQATTVKVGKVIEEHIRKVEGGAVWEDGWDDARVAKIATTADNPVTSGHVGGLRRALFGNFPSDSAGVIGQLRALERRIEALEERYTRPANVPNFMPARSNGSAN